MFPSFGPLARMEFLQPLLLTGLAAAAGPILLHLLRKRQSQSIDWGAMAFLEPDESTRRRWQLEDWILLAIRVAIIVLLVAYFARPTVLLAWTDWLNLTPPRDRILVIDASYSMSSRSAGGSPADRARELALSLLDQSVSGDRWWLVESRDQPRLLVDGATDPDEIRQALANPDPSSSSGNWPRTLSFALERLPKDARRPAEFWLLTDQQAEGWKLGDRTAWLTLTERMKLLSNPPRLFAIEDNELSVLPRYNRAVGPVSVDRPQSLINWPVTLRVPLQSWGAHPAGDQVTVALRDVRANRLLAEQVVRVTENHAADVEFVIRHDVSGCHPLVVELSPGDDLSVDDRAAIVIETLSGLPVLLVEGHPDARRAMDRATFFLEAALSGGRNEESVFQTTRIAVDRIAEQELANKAVVILADVGTLEPPALDALEKYVRQGGTLVWGLGGRATPENLTAWSERGLIGARPVELRSVSSDEAVTVAEDSLEADWLKSFRTAAGGHLGQARFHGWWRMQVAPPDVKQTQLGSSVVLARLAGGDIWLLEQQVGSGRTVVVTSPFDTSWSTLPTKPDFVVWLHELLFQLARTGASRNLPVGTPLRAPEAGEWTLPNGTRQATGPDPNSLVLDRTWQPGLYQWRPNGKADFSQEQAWALDASRNESNLTRLTQEERQQIADAVGLKWSPPQLPGELVDEVSSDSKAASTEVSPALLAGFLLLLIVEAFWTRRLVASA